MIDWGLAEEIPREYDKWFDEAVVSSLAYLRETDWQVTAKYERKRPIPKEVQKLRAQALDVLVVE